MSNAFSKVFANQFVETALPFVVSLAEPPDTFDISLSVPKFLMWHIPHHYSRP